MWDVRPGPRSRSREEPDRGDRRHRFCRPRDHRVRRDGFRSMRISPRELDVLRLIAEGATNREIGERLYLSPHTVKEYASSLYRKLGITSRVGAVHEGHRRGYLQ